jgi:cyanophycinase-like exopeptidase
MYKTLLLLLFPISFFAQDYTIYHTGPTSDSITIPEGGICLMGGATEDDNAMRWFLNRANGGDILVLRASGADGYNDYFYTDLGVNVHSVETIVCNNANASTSSYIHTKIAEAEAIWFAGGDQWNYISYWRGTAIDSLINKAISERNIVIGGTSAGMAIQGKYYFSAQNGTITSGSALSNPFDVTCTVDSLSFIQNDVLNHTITDTHFDSPDRKGRLSVFMAKILSEYGDLEATAIACNEYTAVCIDENGLAKVFGGYPTYDEFAYFVQINCEIPSNVPENYSIGNPLTWNQSGKALSVCRVPGTSTGLNTFDLNDWKTTNGGSWYNWSVDNGVFSETIGIEPNCITGISDENSEFEKLPKMITNQLIEFNSTTYKSVVVSDITGKVLQQIQSQNGYFTVDLRSLSTGTYFLNYSK